MTTKIRDEAGNTIQGLFKDPSGAIIVEKTSDYDRYLNERQQRETINNLKQEVSELKEVIHALIAKVSSTESKDNKWQQ